MNMSLLDNAQIVQNAYVTDDIEATCHQFNRLYGIGPFLLGKNNIPPEQVVHDGKPAQQSLEFEFAVVQSGDLNIEIVQPHSSESNAFTDMLVSGQTVLHHVAIFAQDYEVERDAFVSEGYPLATEITSPTGLALCFLDTRQALGHMVELYKEGPVLRTIYEKTRQAAESWDGKDLIHNI